MTITDNDSAAHPSVRFTSAEEIMVLNLLSQNSEFDEPARRRIQNINLLQQEKKVCGVKASSWVIVCFMATLFLLLVLMYGDIMKYVQSEKKKLNVTMSRRENLHENESLIMDKKLF